MLVKQQSVKSRFGRNFLSCVPSCLLKSMVKVNPLFGYYHLVSDEDVPHIKHLYVYKNVKQFKDDLDFILKKFRPLGLSDLIEYLKNGQAPPDYSFLLTYDDGLKEAAEIIAPILLSKGVPGAFFVCSAFMDNKRLATNHKASLFVEWLK